MSAVASRPNALLRQRSVADRPVMDPVHSGLEVNLVELETRRERLRPDLERGFVVDRLAAHAGRLGDGRARGRAHNVPEDPLDPSELKEKDKESVSIGASN